MSTTPAVLLMSAGGYQGLALVRALRALGGLRLIVSDCFEECTTRYFADRFVQAPRIAEQVRFADFVLALCASEGVGHVFACTNLELAALEALRDRLQRMGVVLHVSLPAALALGADKLAFYQWAERHGLCCLPTFASPLAAPVQLGKLVGKQRDGFGSKSMLTVRAGESPAGMDAVASEDYVWQVCLPEFEEFSLDFAVTPSGTLTATALRRRIRTVSGFAVLCEPCAPAAVEALALDTAQALAAVGARGPLNLQLLWAQDQAYVSDFNPRVGTSMPLSLVAGINPLAGLFGRLDPPISAPPQRSFRYLNERAVHVQDLGEVRGVVFDLDDTLFDQKRWMRGKLEMTWAALQADLPRRSEFLSSAWCLIEEGQRARLFDALCAEYGWEEALRERLIAQYRAAIPQEDCLYDDARATLQSLRRMGYRIGLLTDNPAQSQRDKLAAAGLADCFDTTVLTADLGCGKPDPRCFEACCRGLDLAPEQLVMVGDHYFRDVRGALRAGYRHAFRIHREGAMFNFSDAICSGLEAGATPPTLLQGLHELHWYLGDRTKLGELAA